MLRASKDPEILTALRILVHDSLVIEAPEDRIRDILTRLAVIMEEPNEILGGLRVGTESKMGRSWLFKEE